MVYGTTLHLPGEFFTPSPTTSLPDPSDFLNTLKSHFRQVKPTPPTPTTKNANIPWSLSTATHVFVRHDAVRTPLQPFYDGPYPVTKRTNKFFTIKLDNRTDISVDRLKPAHIDSMDTSLDLCLPEYLSHQTQPTSSSPQPRLNNEAQMPTTTRSGRRVHFPPYIFHTTCKILGGGNDVVTSSYLITPLAKDLSRTFSDFIFIYNNHLQFTLAPL